MPLEQQIDVMILDGVCLFFSSNQSLLAIRLFCSLQSLEGGAERIICEHVLRHIIRKIEVDAHLHPGLCRLLTDNFHCIIVSLLCFDFCSLRQRNIL